MAPGADRDIGESLLRRNKRKATTRPMQTVATWVRRQPPMVKAFLAVVSWLGALFFLGMVVHDQDNLFVLAEVFDSIGTSS
ncbi:unnamed protein product [Dovyalis caffra]|uniref:Uncharacterized protein n=1 Tax=Dovyalis caffra TaxID=77055 RepID=A0AAV1S426_9ROSI|nr:unnamed protein product [Dovyalis caffra]